jgi:hypothetical protein
MSLSIVFSLLLMTSMTSSVSLIVSGAIFVRVYDIPRVDATAVQPPPEAPGYRLRIYARDEVRIAVFYLAGRRRESPLIGRCDFPDGSRIVHLPTSRRPPRAGWFTWDPDRMQMKVPSRTVTATVERHPRAGDAATARPPRPSGTQQQVLPFDEQRYWPLREAQIRVGGQWRRGRLLCRSRWPGGQDTVHAWVWLPEPVWGLVRFERIYLYDPRAISPVG